MKKVLTILFFIICSSILYSQSSYIQVISKSGVSVFLDDTFKGKTSVDMGGLIIEDVSSGSHTLKFVKEGFNPQEERINIKSGEVFSYRVKDFIPKIKISQKGNEDENSIELITGDLKIQSLPISINISIPKLGINSKKDEDEWLGEDIPTGEYNSTFTWNGKKLNKTILIETDKITHILVNFPKMEVEDRFKNGRIEENKINNVNFKSNRENNIIGKKNDVEKMKLYGKVKSLRKISYKVVEKYGDIYKGDISYKYSSNVDCKFNEDGVIMEENMYDSYDGSLETKKIYIYDDKGNKIEEIYNNSEGFPTVKKKYKYDDKGNNIELNGYRFDGILSSKYTHTFDDKGNEIESNSYNPDDGTLKYKMFKRYDIFGNLILISQHYPNGKLYHKLTYKYDDKGNKIELNKYGKKYTFKYEFYENNNWIKRIDYEDGIPITIVERTIEYYK